MSLCAPSSLIAHVTISFCSLLIPNYLIKKQRLDNHNLHNIADISLTHRLSSLNVSPR